MKDITKGDIDISSKLTKMISQVTTQVHSEAIDGKDLYEKYIEKESERQYEDEAVIEIGERITIITQAPAQFKLLKHISLLWHWENYLWPCYSFTTWWKGYKNIHIRAIAFFPVNTPETNLFFKKDFRIVLLHKTKCIAAFEVDIKKLEKDYWNCIPKQTVKTYVHEIEGAKAYVHSSIASHEVQTTSDILEKGWALQLGSWVGGVVRFYEEAERQDTFTKELELVGQTQFSHLFNKDNTLARIYWEFVRLFWKNEESPIKFCSLIHSEFSDSPLIHHVMLGLMHCAWHSAIGTERGNRIVSIEIDGTRKSLPLVEHLPVKCTKHYWERVALSLPMYHSQLLGPGSCPIDFEEVKEYFPLYQGDIEKGKEFLESLLMEAVSSKQWTIPYGAYIQMNVGPFKAIKMFELNDDVACVLVDTSGHYFMVWVNPYTQKFVFVHDQNLYQKALIKLLDEGMLGTLMKSGMPEEEIKRISRQENLHENIKKQAVFDMELFQLGVEIILTAIIRDFWVIEERERVFGRGMNIRKSARLRSDWGKKSIVYLPRIRYIDNVNRGEEQLHVVARKAHFVVGHLRKAVHAGEQQIILAQRFGIIVPEGFTFVRPHKRGDKAQERIFRSRSALQCLNALSSIDKIEADDWFTYELNVKNWLKENGYEVEHLAGNKNGDGGVDIQASKEDEHLLVQCKFWLTQKVGPNVVREMLGTLQTFPSESKGVIITASEITEGAKKLAIDHGIQFIERANFSKKIETPIQQS